MYDDLKDLYSKTIPEIKRFEDKIVEFSLEQEKTEIIVRRFDEIMSEKASKIDLKDVAKNLQQYTKNTDFITATKLQNDKLANYSHKIQDLEHLIDVMGKNVSKDIYSAVKKATSL